VTDTQSAGTPDTKAASSARAPATTPIADRAPPGQHDGAGRSHGLLGAAILPEWAPVAALEPADRRRGLGHCGATVWLTGLPASGKSTLAGEIERALVAQGRPAFRLDGDELRRGICRDLGFSRADRDENVRRAALIARWFAEAGVVALVALVSPHADARARARETHEQAGVCFLEVHVDTPLEVCEQRDPKGLYRQARAGALRGFTGIDDPYEPPVEPELRLGDAPVGAWTSAVLAALAQREQVAA
jgi:bifunctional enzyme CysN/CysC